MIYEWDEAKNRSNITKPRLSIIEAAIQERDTRPAQYPFITLGLLAGRVVVIAHTLRGHDTTRIISMRKANRREQETYQKRLGKD